MSQLKLTADSGGGTVAIKGPASTTGNAALELTVPSTASGTLDSLNRAGNILQVVQTAKSDVTSAQPNQTYTDISGFSASITPLSSSNKILVTVMMFAVGNDTTALRLNRGNTSILQGDDVAGKELVAAGVYQTNSSSGGNYYGAKPITLVKLDSPSSTSAVTYKMQWKTSNSSNTLYLNRNLSNTNQYSFRTVSTITLMEVAA